MGCTHDASGPVGTNLRQPHLSGDLTNIFGHSARTIAMDDFIGAFLQCWAAPTDRNSNLTRRQQVMVVLGVANPNRVVRRKPEYLQDLLQTGALADGGWKNHETAAVEQQDEWKFELPDHLKNLRSRSCIGFNDALADVELKPTPAPLSATTASKKSRFPAPRFKSERIRPVTRMTTIPRARASVIAVLTSGSR